MSEGRILAAWAARDDHHHVGEIDWPGGRPVLLPKPYQPWAPVDVQLPRATLDLRLQLEEHEGQAGVDIVTVATGRGEPAAWRRVAVAGGPALPFSTEAVFAHEDVDAIFGDDDRMRTWLDEHAPNATKAEGWQRYLMLTRLGRESERLSGVPAGDAGGVHASVERFFEDTAPVLLFGLGALRTSRNVWVSSSEVAVWAGEAEGEVVALALDVGSGFRDRVEALTATVDDAFAEPVGSPLVATSGEALPDGYELHRAFVAGTDRQWLTPYTIHRAGTLRAPSGRFVVLDPRTPGRSVEIAVDVPPDRDLPCFFCGTSEGFETLLVRVADGMPVRWQLGPLTDGPTDDGYYGCSIDAGCVGLVDAALEEQIRAPEWRQAYAARRTLADPFGVVAVGGADAPNYAWSSAIGGDVPNDVVTGLDADGNVVAIAVDVGGYFHDDEDEDEG